MTDFASTEQGGERGAGGPEPASRMRWFKLTIAYEGTAYHGWQLQAGADSIQGRLELAVQRVTLQRTRATASGRTDAGVHALGQVVSLALSTGLSSEVLLRALNANLPEDIRVWRLVEVPHGFDAITYAQSKTYWYWIRDGRLPDLFWRRRAWFVPQPLDVAAMQQAAHPLVGRHDFRAYQAAGSPRKSTVRHVQCLEVERMEVSWASLIRVQVTADGFLYNMVRNLVGTLVRVGQRREAVQWPAAVLAGRDRRAAGPTAPAHGLFLAQVQYPPPWDS